MPLSSILSGCVVWGYIDCWLWAIISSSPLHQIFRTPNIMVPANRIIILWLLRLHAIVFIIDRNIRHAMKTSSKRLHTCFTGFSFANDIIIPTRIILYRHRLHVTSSCGRMVGHGRCVYFVYYYTYVNDHHVDYKHRYVFDSACHVSKTVCTEYDIIHANAPHGCSNSGISRAKKEIIIHYDLFETYFFSI